MTLLGTSDRWKRVGTRQIGKPRDVADTSVVGDRSLYRWLHIVVSSSNVICMRHVGGQEQSQMGAQCNPRLSCRNNS
jgi:hypothetical protein